LYSCLVQGQGAAEDIVNGIRCLDNMNLDVIIVGRGGGSIEDLWAFNEEIVAKAVFDCNTPVISAVGHETDTTIVDFVADMRAPTPSAAAELAVFDYSEYMLKTDRFIYYLTANIKQQIEKKRSEIKYYHTRLNVFNPESQLEGKKQYLDQLFSKLTDSMNYSLESKKHMLTIYIEKLKGLSPLERISKGYAYISREDGTMICSVSDVSKDDNIELTLADGKINAVVSDVFKGGRDE
jgi:exodeoxyribonuclease VII large subunit